jgi:hypothetical protein
VQCAETKRGNLFEETAQNAKAIFTKEATAGWKLITVIDDTGWDGQNPAVLWDF